MNADDLHHNGIHTMCHPATGAWSTIGSGGSDRCPRAGTVESMHGHDFDGPLWDACGCDEMA